MSRGMRRVKPRFWLILMALMLGVFVYLYTAQDALLEGQEATIAQLREQTEELTVAIADSERRLEFAKSEEYVMRVARSSLGMVMPDEVLYVSSN